MKTRLFNETRNIALYSAFIFAFGLGNISVFAQPGHAWGHYKKENRENNREDRDDNRGRDNEGRGNDRHGDWGEKPGNGHAYGYYRNHGNGNAYGHYKERDYYREPHWQYRSMPSRGAVVSYAPAASVALNFRGLSFFFNNGVYYRPYERGYRVVGAPVGLRINALPRGCVELSVGRMPYYYYCGTYYRNYGGYYEVVRPPVGALVESIPNGYREMNIDGETYYVVDGVQYKPELCNGEVWYRVLKVS
ncbi:MAG: DUF6515 family protein [Bacteroidota bacterium]|nr:DUF6515 family protein [Bacteroidota bacterium]